MEPAAVLRSHSAASVYFYKRLALQRNSLRFTALHTMAPARSLVSPGCVGNVIPAWVTILSVTKLQPFSGPAGLA